MTCSPTCCPPGACAASPASSNARCPTLGSRRALTATGPSRPSHPPKPSPSDEPDPRQTHNATALALGRSSFPRNGAEVVPALYCLIRWLALFRDTSRARLDGSAAAGPLGLRRIEQTVSVWACGLGGSLSGSGTGIAA